MKGLELSRAFYEAYGKPMLERDFPHLLPLIAVGLAGSGSECFGYDDAYSQDHDFEPGFCIFLPSEEILDRKSAFALERAYAKLPREFMGYKRSPLSPVGGNRHGVIRMGDFFRDKTGSEDGRLSARDYFFIPEQSLAEAVNGEVFFDGLGAFSEIRARLAYLPEDVRKKKLAGHIFTMGQAGLYNYPRLVTRGDEGGAQLAVYEFAKSALHTLFLLDKVYLPYYKWVYRALADLKRFSSLSALITALLTSGNGEKEAKKKQDIIGQICKTVFSALREDTLSAYAGDTAEGHAYSVNDRIENAEIRNLHILYGV